MKYRAIRHSREGRAVCNTFSSSSRVHNDEQRAPRSIGHDGEIECEHPGGVRVPSDLGAVSAVVFSHEAAAFLHILV